MISQVTEAEKALKMKIRPINAFLKCYKLDFLSALPTSVSYQFVWGVYHPVCFPLDQIGAVQAGVHPQNL